jgi:hypothetical protein
MSAIENQTPGPARRLGVRLVAATIVVALIAAAGYAIHAVSHSSGYDAGYAAGQRTGDAAGEQAGEASGETAGEAAGERAGEIAGRRAGERIGEVAGKRAGERVGFEHGRTVGFAHGEADGAAAGAQAALGGFGDWAGGGYYVVTMEPGGQPGVPYRIATRTALRPLTNYRLCESDEDRLCALPVVVAAGG